MVRSSEQDGVVSSILPAVFRLKDGREALVRRMMEDDAAALCEFLPQTHRESDFLNYLPGEFTKTVDEEKEFIRTHNAKPQSISLAVLVDGEIVGIAGAASLELRRFVHHAELGLTVRKAFWGLGAGRKLMECLVEWGRRSGLRKLYLKVFDNNVRAIELYHSLGFVEEARLKGDALRADGTYGDTLVMAKFFV